MENLQDRVIRQFDTLVPFLAVSHEEVFDIIRQNEAVWFPSGESASLPETYRMYQFQVSHAAFLLGYSYFEAFLADLAKQVLRARPQLLPKEKGLKFKDVLDCGSYDQVLSFMIEKEVFTLLYNSMDKIISYFDERLNLSFGDTLDKENIIKASLLRNCLIHNMALADKRLAPVSRWGEGSFIDLESYEVHELGIIGRRISRNLYEQAQAKHLNKS